MTDNLPKHVRYWLSEAQHDCFFLVGPESGPTERIGAMRTLLTGFSEPLRAMLQDSELAEPGDIRLIDVEPETFRNFLKCVYGGSDVVIPKLSFAESAKLLYVTDKYLVEDVKTEITTYLQDIWSHDKIFLALSNPIFFTEQVLKDKMLGTLQKGFIDITMDKEFLNLSEDAVTWILQQYLNVKEVEIWIAILKWAQHQTKSNNGKVLRSHILPFFKYIGFLVMDHKDFLGNVVSSGILLKEEIDEIMLFYCGGNIPSIEHLCKNKKHRYRTPKESNNIVSDSFEIPSGKAIVCTVNNICNLASKEYSQPVILAGFPWQLIVLKSTVNNKDRLSLHVLCNNFFRGWPHPVQHTCKTNVTITLVNQMGQLDCQRIFFHEFSSQKILWGLRNFCDWSTVIDPEKGFMKENKIIVIVRIHLVD